MNNPLKREQKQFAWLIDPERSKNQRLAEVLQRFPERHPDFFLIGGSLLLEEHLHDTLQTLRAHSEKPLILFPGNLMQISPRADAILFLSLISGRNPEFLIGQHIQAAPLVKEAGLTPIPTGYLLVDGGVTTAVHYLTQTLPLPRHKPELAAVTALAGEQLGQQAIYLEAGSGARYPVPSEMIRHVREQIRIPLLVGGGIRTTEAATRAWHSGADVVVVGSVLESKPELLPHFIQARDQANKVGT